MLEEVALLASGSIVSFNPRGCNCHDCNGLKCGLQIAPTAYLVERDGRILGVCTRCLLESDRIIEILADEHAPYGIYERYDSVGAIELVAKLTARAYATQENSAPPNMKGLGGRPLRRPKRHWLTVNPDTMSAGCVSIFDPEKREP